MYRYDVAGQLVQTTDMRYGTTQYQYDTAGNLIRETNGADVTDYRYNKLNQLVSKTTPEGSFVYEYDKRGNLIAEKQGGTALYTYEYDASNRMVMGVNVSTDETSEYIYNGLGMRTANIQTTQNASYGSRNISNSQGSELIGHMDFFALVDRPVDVQKTFADNFGLTRQSKPAIINREYVVDYTNMYNRDLAVYEEGSYVTSYTYGLGLNKISQTVMNYPNKTEIGIEGQNSYTDLAVEKYLKLYLHQDRLGSTIRMTRENGTTIAWADYDEWGKPRSPIDHDMNMAGIDNAIGFTSYTYDQVLDKYFAQARMYDQNNRRFMAVDPIKDGLNWYVYVGNSPITFIDPWGLVEVVAKEYLERRGADVTWTGNETRNGILYANATVKYNGKKNDISGIVRDGRLMYDDDALADILGWHSSVYYFYGKDQEGHATSNIKDLRENSYGVAAYFVASEDEFIGFWNLMPESVDVVVVNLHGAPTTIEYMNLNRLDLTKNIGTAVFLSCNVGHQHTNTNNIVEQILSQSNGAIRQLVAPDGTHYRGTFLNPFRGVEVKGDATWKSYYGTSVAQGESSVGFVKYSWDTDDSTYNTESIGKSFASVRKLLAKVGA